VVDDAIVVVEGVHAKLDQGYKSAKLASIDAMSLMFRIVWFQEYRTQGGTQCQGVQSGQTDSDRHRQTELAYL